MVKLYQEHVIFLLENIYTHYQNKFRNLARENQTYDKCDTTLENLKEIVKLVFGQVGEVIQEKSIADNENSEMGGFLLIRIKMYRSFNEILGINKNTVNIPEIPVSEELYILFSIKEKELDCKTGDLEGLLQIIQG